MERAICIYVSQARKLLDLLSNDAIRGEYSLEELKEYDAIRDTLNEALRRDYKRQREVAEMGAMA